MLDVCPKLHILLMTAPFEDPSSALAPKVEVLEPPCLVKFGCVFEVCEQTDRQTDKQTDVLITILTRGPSSG